MASGSLAFDNESPASGAQVQLTVSITDYQSNAVSLQVSPDPGDGSNGKTVTFADPNNPSAQVPITAGAAGTTFTFSLIIDGQAAVDGQGGPIQAQLQVQAPATTTTAPATTTTASATTTTAPATTTTTAPTTTTTAPGTTTTAPAGTTTTAPGTTTTAPAGTTTTAPGSTTTTAPGSTTTTAPAGTTTTAPGGTTTTAPGGTTTTAPGSTTTTAPGTPAFTSVEVDVDPDDGADHHAHSVQVAADVKLTLKWETSGATGIRIEGLGDFGASDSQEIPTKDASYSLVAKGDGGAESAPWPLEVHTHDPSQVVSPHVDVGSGVAAVVSFTATKDDQTITAAKVGESILLELVVSDATETAKITDQDADLSDTGDGHKRATLSVTLTADMNGGFEARALKDGQDPDIKTLQLDVSSDAAPVLHFSADPPGPVASNTAVTFKWTIDNFVLPDTTAQVSADADPGDANFTFGGQEVHLDADGSGTLAVTPTNAGDFNFKLSVTPSGGTAVDSDPLKVTVGTAPVPHLTSDATGPVAPNTAMNLKWTIDNFVSGTTAQISADADPGDASFTFGGQDVTLESDGSGTLAVTPTKEGDYNFTLKVTPPGGSAVSTDPLKITSGAGGLTAEWSTDTVHMGDVAQMKVAGFAPNAQVQLEVTMAGVGVIATPDPVTCDASGAASLDFQDWFSAAKSPDNPPAIPDGQDFPAVTFTFKATAGSQEATSVKPITYSDSLAVQFVSHDDGSALANTAYTLESPWGTRSGTTDDQGSIQVDHLPPGGVRVMIAGDVLTTSDAA